MNPKQQQIKAPYEDAIKYGFILILVIIGVIVLSKIAKAFGGNSEVSAAKGEINNKQLSYSDAEYESFAAQLEQAFKGVGTTQETVVAVIKRLKNSSDWYALFTAFGIRKIPHLLGSNSGTLTTHLEYELEDNPEEYQLIKTHLNSLGVTI